MKTVEEIFTYQRLYRSMKECSKGQKWKGSIINFNINYVENLLCLEEELANGTYRAKPDNITYIHERGKVRMIHSQHIRDRIVHKIINQDILIPIFHKRFIRQNSASQKDKGVDFALKTFKCHLNRAHRKWNMDFYILNIDMKKYFESISHEYIMSLIREEISDERLVSLCAESMKAYGGERGLGLGSEMNQTYALLCLNEYDHKIKEQFHIEEYGRYMDDIHIIHNDKEFLREILNFSENYFESIGMRANKKKTQISPMKNGTTYLGFRWRVTDTGHILQIAKKQTITRDKKKLRKLRVKLDEGVFTFPEVANSGASMRGNIDRGNCLKTVKEFDKYFNKLFIESWVNEYEQQAVFRDAESAVYPE